MKEKKAGKEWLPIWHRLLCTDADMCTQHIFALYQPCAATRITIYAERRGEISSNGKREKVYPGDFFFLLLAVMEKNKKSLPITFRPFAVLYPLFSTTTGERVPLPGEKKLAEISVYNPRNAWADPAEFQTALQQHMFILVITFSVPETVPRHVRRRHMQTMDPM